MEYIIAVGFILIVLLLLYNTMVEPFKIVYKILLKFIIGGAMVWVINLIGIGFDYHISINFITAGISGFLGLPGLLLLMSLRIMI